MADKMAKRISSKLNMTPRGGKFATPSGMEGWLTKHRRIRQPWAEVERLEGNFKRRWFVVQGGVLFYFESQKAWERAQESEEAVSISAKGFIPLHAVEVVENESVSDYEHSFVLQITKRDDQDQQAMLPPRALRECMLLCAENAETKQRWLQAIDQWQQQNLANVQKFDYMLSDDEDEENSYTVFHTEEGIPYYMDNATRQTMWTKPEPSGKGKRRMSCKRLSHGSFILWVKVSQARNLTLPESDKVGNPFCKVQYKGLEFKTPRTGRTPNPDWSGEDTSFEFLVEEKDLNSDSPDDSLRVSVMAAGLMGSLALIGAAYLPLSDFWEAFGTTIDKRLQLQSKSGFQGELTLKLHLSIAAATPRQRQDAMPSPSPHMVQNQFGVLLTSIEKDPTRVRNGVPRLVAEACESVRKRGMDEVGIFRLSGSKSSIHRLKVYSNLNWEFDLDSEDVNTVAGLLKLFLREMPEPLFPSAFYHTIIMAMGELPPFCNSGTSEQDKALALKQVVDSPDLPAIHKRTMAVVFGLMVDIAALADTNKMHPKNLAVVLGPNVIRTAQGDVEALNDMPHAQLATELCIRFHSYLFPDK